MFCREKYKQTNLTGVFKKFQSGVYYSQLVLTGLQCTLVRYMNNFLRLSLLSVRNDEIRLKYQLQCSLCITKILEDYLVSNTFVPVSTDLLMIYNFNF